MKQTTFDKYVDFLRILFAAGTIYDINQSARHNHIGDGFVSFLKKRGYLERMSGGSYKFKSGGLGFAHIIASYIAFQRSAKPVVKEFCDKVSEAYPHVTNTAQMSDKLTTEQREQAAIAILGSIMRDNAGVTYKVTRIENKEIVLL